MTFAEMLADLRTAAGLSQEQLAERSGVSVRAIGEIERGATRRPQRETVRALAGALALAAPERAAFEKAARTAPPAVTRSQPGARPVLPAPVSSLVGRDDDLTAVTRLVRDPVVRLVTITGPGGVGKTRLALAVAWRSAGRFTRVHGVDLGTLQRADDVPQALADALGRTGGHADPAAAVAAAIGDARWLLVLDSFEHVTAAAATLGTLLAGCPRLTVLTTSRAPLRLRGEHLWPLEPLATPARDALADLAESPAVRLLVERTAAVRPGFAATAGNASALAALTRRLDGLPLALELAAAHLRTQEPAHLLTQVAALSGDAIDRPDRHQSLRRTVEWSTGRLSPADRRLLGVLGVFAGGADPDDVRAVLSLAGGDTPADPDASLVTLAAQSLATVSDRDGRARVGLLDSIREVAAGQLDAGGRGDAVRDAHARHFAGLVGDGSDRLGTELDNVRVAVDRAVDVLPDLLDAPLVQALTGHYLGRGHLLEARRVLSAVAGVAPADAARAWAWHGASIAANETGDTAGALALTGRAAAIFDRLGDARGRGAVLTVRGNVFKTTGRHDQASAAYAEALALARSIGDTRRETVALNNLGTLAHDLGRYDEALRYYAQSLDLKRGQGDRRGIPVAQVNMATVEIDTGRHADAAARLNEAAEAFVELGDLGGQAFALAMVAQAYAGLDRHDDARAAAEQALALARKVDYALGVGLALMALGEIAAATGDPGQAAELLREALDYPLCPPERTRVTDELAALSHA